jgi:hypothetical protein
MIAVLLDRMSRVSFDRAVWGAAAASALHEADEWNILSWYREHWNNVGGLSTRTVWTWLAFFSLLGFAVGFLCTRLRNRRIAAHVAVLFFSFPFLHCFLHLHWVFYFGAYSPGVLSSVLLLIPACALLGARAISEQLVPAWFVLLSCVLNLPPIIGAILLGDTLPDGGLPFYRFSRAIAESLFGAW